MVEILGRKLVWRKVPAAHQTDQLGSPTIVDEREEAVASKKNDIARAVRGVGPTRQGRARRR